MRLLFLGDVVGEPGRKIIKRHLAAVRAHWAIDCVIANAENASGGSGLDPRCYRQLESAGIDACTMGDHVYRKKEIVQLFEAGRPICRPANFPARSPGPDHLVVHLPSGLRMVVVNVMGRTFMRPVDCPFDAIDRVLAAIDRAINIIIVDIHAEATADKQLMLRHCLGRVSAVLGTHTHVPTADAAILPPGVAYITDVGMTGPYDSVIGRDVHPTLHHARTFEPIHFDVATKDVRMSGALVDIDETTGHAVAIELFHQKAEELERLSASMQSESVRPIAG